ncbi:MAG: DNA primase [Cytophagaceae bacterium]|jgi:DNA primase|nr:DNA primase [Cytophagaceae bacterium]
MPVRLTKETIDQIQQSIDILEVINDFVSLKKKGHYYSACCPFHNEKTPSFTVTPAKGIYKCFGCGKAGDAVQFVMDHESMTYPEAMVYLAKKYNIEITTGELESGMVPSEVSEKESMWVVLNYARQYYSDLLWNSENGKAIGLSYFKERGFSESTIRTFELGYSSESWDAFTKEAETKGYQREFLVKTGLTIEKENANDSASFKYFDRFRNRVMFPIHSVTGKVVGFGARILTNDKKEAKYLNSPESAVYQKSKLLYGLFQSKNGIRRDDRCYLVEGYTDVISLHQAGVDNVVASSGTSLTEDQIKLIRRYTPNITVLYDGDPAGIRASLRGIDMILEQDMNVSVVLFPNGEDPDSYVRSLGGPEFKRYIEANRQDFITFKTKLALDQAQNDPIQRAEVIRDIVESISKIPDGIKRSVFFKECSQLLQIDEQVLISEYNKKAVQASKQKKNKEEKEGEYPTPTIPLDLPEEEVSVLSLQEKAIENEAFNIIRLLLNHADAYVDTEVTTMGYIIQELREEVQFKNPVYQQIFEELNQAFENGTVPSQQHWIQHPDEKIRQTAIEMLLTKYQVSTIWTTKHNIEVPQESDVLDTIVPKSILRLKRTVIHSMMEELLKELKEVSPSGSIETVEQLMKTYGELKSISIQIEKKLSIEGSINANKIK